MSFDHTTELCYRVGEAKENAMTETVSLKKMYRGDEFFFDLEKGQIYTVEYLKNGVEYAVQVRNLDYSIDRTYEFSFNYGDTFSVVDLVGDNRSFWVHFRPFGSTEEPTPRPLSPIDPPSWAAGYEYTDSFDF